MQPQRVRKMLNCCRWGDRRSLAFRLVSEGVRLSIRAFAENLSSLGLNGHAIELTMPALNAIEGDRGSKVTASCGTDVYRRQPRRRRL